MTIKIDRNRKLNISGRISVRFSNMLPFINKAITRILQHHLAVVIDIHDEQKTFENEINAQKFVIFWSNFAKHLSQFDTNNVYLELLNEPVFDGKEDSWLTLQKKLITKVREQAPNNTIIATGANWGGIEGLQKVKPYQDTNIIYSFHYYEPSAFTHQGADWAGNEYPSIANLEYPTNPANCEQVLGNVKIDAAVDLVQEYCDKKWDKNTIASFIQQAQRQTMFRYGLVNLAYIVNKHLDNQNYSGLKMSKIFLSKII